MTEGWWFLGKPAPQPRNEQTAPDPRKARVQLRLNEHLLECALCASGDGACDIGAGLFAEQEALEAGDL